MSKLSAALAALTLLAFAAPGVAGADDSYPGPVTTEASAEEVEEGVWDEAAGQEIDPDEVDWADGDEAGEDAAATATVAASKARSKARSGRRTASERTVATRKAKRSKKRRARRR